MLIFTYTKYKNYLLTAYVNKYTHYDKSIREKNKLKAFNTHNN